MVALAWRQMVSFLCQRPSEGGAIQDVDALLLLKECNCR